MAQVYDTMSLNQLNKPLDLDMKLNYYICHTGLMPKKKYIRKHLLAKHQGAFKSVVIISV